MYVRVTRGQGDPARVEETIRLVPDVSAALRQLPGCRGVQVGVDRATGKSVAVSTFDTLQQARFARESLGDPIARLVAAGWQGEAPEIYEVVE
jgi:hypothetical protein